MSNSSKTAKSHWHKRLDSEAHYSLKQWCLVIHRGCHDCQTFVGNVLNPKTGEYAGT